MKKNIKLYRNHTPECKAQLAQTYRKLPTDAKRKKAIVNYLGCECPLWYRCAGEPHGKTTGTRDEQEAKNFVQGLDLGQGNADKTVTGEVLKDCITKFTDERAGQLAKGTKEAYDDLLAQLQAYATLKGKAYIRDLDVDFFLDFKTYGMGDIAETPKKMRFAKLKAFVGDALSRGWITNPALQPALKKIKFAANQEPTQPYTEDEVSRILEVAGTVNGKSEGYGRVPGTFRLLCELMNETGMRVSDAISFNPNSCFAGSKQGRWIYQYYPRKHRRTSTPKLAQVYISNRLKVAVETCAWMSEALPFTYCAVNDETLEKLTREIYKRLNDVIGPKAGVTDCRAHRFRDSFAVRWIMKGLGVEQVSKLLNHSKIQITVDYYLPWILRRQTMLEDSFFGPES
jgi:integrase